MSEPWLPSDEEIERVRALLDIGALRALIRSAVEKALAEERARWTAALRSAAGEAESGPGFRELYEKAEADPDYWAALLRMGREAYDKATARHARELERAKLEARASALAWAHDRGSWPAVQAEWRRAHEALAALDKERKP